VRRRIVVIGQGSVGEGAGPPTPVYVLSFDGPVPAWSQVDGTGAVPPDLAGRSASLDEATGSIVSLWGASGGEPAWAVEPVAHLIRFVEVPEGTVGAPPASVSSALALDAPSPHPARASFRIGGVLPAAEPATLELLDPAGRRRESRRLDAVAGRFETRFATDRLAPGLYFLRVTQSGRSATTKLVVVR
jgi:hypothetical protein